MFRTFSYALRHLRRSPGITIAAILSLALGIGATTAMFTLMDALLLRPLPVWEPDRLVRIEAVDDAGGSLGISAPLFELLRRAGIFDGLCGFHTQAPTIEMLGEIRERWTHAMTGDCFETLGVRAALGRTLEPADELPAPSRHPRPAGALEGTPRVALLTHDVWQRELGGRPDVLGREVTIDGHAVTIVGVTHPGFSGLLVGFPPDLIYPITSEGALNTLARLKRHETLGQVTARLRTVWPGLLEASAPSAQDGAMRERYLRYGFSVTPAATGYDRFALRGRFGRPLTALLGIAALVLLVSCVNVANLLLARAMVKQREMSVRLALGAGRWRLIRDALAESLLLLTAGVGTGVALACWGTELLVSLFSAATYPGFTLDVTPDTRTLSFTCAVAAAAFLLFAFVPALKNSRAEVMSLLAGASRRIVGDRAPLRRALVVAQVALTLSLVTGAALFVSTLTQLRASPLGLTTDGLLMMSLSPLPGAYQHGFSRTVYYRELIERVSHTAGVKDVALGRTPPLSARSRFEPVAVAGVPEREVEAESTVVTDGYLRTMGAPLMAGRDFRRSDVAGDRRTAIISESLAHRLFGTRDSVGEHIRVGQLPGVPRSLEIIGVARDAVLTNPRARSMLVVYENYWQASPGLQQWPTLLVRIDGEAGSIVGAVRRALEAAGREYPRQVRTLVEERDASLAEERLLASLSTTFGWVGLTLAAIGLYGLLAFSVARRAGEIGIRMALGAERSHILGLVLREALVLIAFGVAIGLPITLVGASAVRSLLYGVGPVDVAPLAVSISVLVIVGVLAAWFPARRAASVAPAAALRHQ